MKILAKYITPRIVFMQGIRTLKNQQMKDAIRNTVEIGLINSWTPRIWDQYLKKKNMKRCFFVISNSTPRHSTSHLPTPLLAYTYLPASLFGGVGGGVGTYKPRGGREVGRWVGGKEILVFSKQNGRPHSKQFGKKHWSKQVEGNSRT